jgi:hypothetical protein
METILVVAAGGPGVHTLVVVEGIVEELLGGVSRV